MAEMPDERARRVLVVDDLDDTRELFAMFLRDAGYIVDEARDGEDALAAVIVHRPDAIVMDIAMPRLDGVEATRRLKEDPRTASIPIVIVTAHATKSEASRARAAGADAVLTKPCFREDLVAEVAKRCSVSASPA